MNLGEIGNDIHEARRQRKWTQGYLAQRVGVSQGHISKIELGKVTDWDTIHKICAEVGLDSRKLAARAFGVLSKAEAAIDNDPALRSDDRALLLIVYREMVKRGPLGGEITKAS